jgi:hypothetical protein
MTTWPPPPAWKPSAAACGLPDDVSVVGFDDAPIAGVIWPTLTTIRQPFDQMALRAMQTFNAWNANEAPARRRPVPRPAQPGDPRIHRPRPRGPPLNERPKRVGPSRLSPRGVPRRRPKWEET